MEITEELYNKAVVPMTLKEYEELGDAAKLLEENKKLKEENAALNGKISWLEYDLSELRSLYTERNLAYNSLKERYEELLLKLQACESR
ncbi:hypothetical protein DIGNKC_92 [Bacillus phage DIGNKC]|uniref:hypothetical protein n=1 Tax=Bacillus phage DIGNKC TaxID=1805948 RepID=UPI0007A77094|nr:hypothetical protein BI007_gp282 [Bacillus phage DIGNKC]AMW62665.1 hypothetical protein DIGNKC_92 [Bacillus phage DIGNKC]